ncbi:MAG: hypothetical protein AAGJ40_08955 [Planctomycetota bacterium]
MSLIHPTSVIIACVLAIAIGGCARTISQVDVPPPPPPIFDVATPSIEELAAAINRTDAVRELSTNSARVDVLSMPAVPKLTASMHLRRQKSFRLRASLPIMMGTGLDLGSNDNEFWFEVPEGMSQTLYYANHDQYSAQLDRAILPVDPSWMIQAIGLPRLDTNKVSRDGVVARRDGMLEVRTLEPSPAGTYQRVMLIEPSAGYVTHLFLYAPDMRLVAKSIASKHQYYDTVDVVLPHEVKVELFPASGPPLAMQMEIDRYTVNQLLSGDPQLFVMPTTARRFDLVQLAGGASSMIGNRSAVPPSRPVSQYSAKAELGTKLR